MAAALAPPARGTCFASVDDVFAWAELPVEFRDRVRDRGIVL